MTLWLACGAGLAVALEAIGTAAGERKRMRRRHVGVIVAVSAVGAAVLSVATGTIGLGLVVAMALLAFAACEGDELLGERAALALALAAATVVAVTSGGAPLTLVAYATCAVLAEAGLAARPGDSASIEAATKAAFVGGAGVVVLGAGAVLPATVGAPLWLLGLMLVLGVTPLHGTRTDVGQGAPPGVVALWSLQLMALGGAVADALARSPREAQWVVVGLALVGLPLVTLAQVSVRRVMSLLTVAQLAPVVVAGIVSAPVRPVVATAGLGVVAVALATAQWPTLSRPASTWEDVSGAGRLMPWRAGLVIVACACACGLPPSLGAAARRALVSAAVAEDAALGGALPALTLVGGGLLALPIVRLALFLFAKTPRSTVAPPTTIAATVMLAVVVAIALVGGLWT